eukprot:m.190345 g.190345  ORF g.190345 m.190345 type:complete len:741 (-) comp14815_c0_seq2:153-2375(-)
MASEMMEEMYHRFVQPDGTFGVEELRQVLQAFASHMQQQYEHETSQLQDRLNRTLAEKNELASRFKYTEEELARAEAEVADLQETANKLPDLAAENQRLRAELSDTKRELEKMTDQDAEHADKLRCASSRIALLEEENMVRTGEVKSLQDQLHRIELTREVEELEIEATQDKRAQLEGELDRYEACVQDLRQQLEAKQVELEVQLERVEGLTQELVETKEALLCKEEEVAEVRLQAQEAEMKFGGAAPDGSTGASVLDEIEGFVLQQLQSQTGDLISNTDMTVAVLQRLLPQLEETAIGAPLAQLKPAISKPQRGAGADRADNGNGVVDAADAIELEGCDGRDGERDDAVAAEDDESKDDLSLSNSSSSSSTGSCARKRNARDSGRDSSCTSPTLGPVPSISPPATPRHNPQSNIEILSIYGSDDVYATESSPASVNTTHQQPALLVRQVSTLDSQRRRRKRREPHPQPTPQQQPRSGSSTPFSPSFTVLKGAPPSAMPFSPSSTVSSPSFTSSPPESPQHTMFAQSSRSGSGHSALHSSPFSSFSHQLQPSQHSQSPTSHVLESSSSTPSHVGVGASEAGASELPMPCGPALWMMSQDELDVLSARLRKQLAAQSETLVQVLCEREDLQRDISVKETMLGRLWEDKKRALQDKPQQQVQQQVQHQRQQQQYRDQMQRLQTHDQTHQRQRFFRQQGVHAGVVSGSRRASSPPKRSSSLFDRVLSPFRPQRGSEPTAAVHS